MLPAVDVVDLTTPLQGSTPILELPPPFANTHRFELEELSRYDEKGPAWYWNDIHTGEHTGTHLDAPVHWVTGRDGLDVSQAPLSTLVAPAVVIDMTAGATSVDRGGWDTSSPSRPVTQCGWLLYRTGWAARGDDAAAFANADENGPHTPGVSPECARWLAEESPIAGFGVETVGTDAGAAHSFEPAFPCHSFMLGAGKYALTQLANLAQLPPAGALLVVLPLKLVGGYGSPCRAVALVEG